MNVDKMLVERITREVVRRLERSAASGGGEAGGVSTGNLVVLVTGTAAGFDEAVIQIEKMRNRYGRLIVVLTRCAEGNGGPRAVGPEFIRRTSPDRVYKESEGASAGEILQGASVLVIPLCNTTTAGKISWLIADSLGPQLVLAALLRRIPVVAAENALLSGLQRQGFTPPAFREIGADLVERLKKTGVRVVDVWKLSESTVGDGGTVVSPAGGFSNADTPSGMSLTGSATVDCRTAVEDIEEYLVSKLADDPTCAPCAARVRESIEECIAAGACRIGTTGSAEVAGNKGDRIAKMIDHTFLKPNATPKDIERLCAEARKFGFKSVCVNPTYVSLCKRLLRGSGVLVCTVIGFPLGATTTAAKAAETRDAVADGADEIDMVINVGALKAGEYEKVKHDIEAVVEAAKGRTVKVILETHLLTDEEKVAACQLCVAAGAHFVKTSTGFGGGGATPEDVALMRKVVGRSLGVKASGGVRTKEDAEKMIRAGATRIGASASVAIVTGKKSQKAGY